MSHTHPLPKPPLCHPHHFSRLPFPWAQESQAHKVAFEEDRQLPGRSLNTPLMGMEITPKWAYLAPLCPVSLARVGFHGYLKLQRKLGNWVFLAFQWEVSKEEGGWKCLLRRHPLESNKWGGSGKVMFDLGFEGLVSVCLEENRRNTQGRETGGDMQQHGVMESST